MVGVEVPLLLVLVIRRIPVAFEFIETRFTLLAEFFKG
jgi:hypothetical protein